MTQNILISIGAFLFVSFVAYHLYRVYFTDTNDYDYYGNFSVLEEDEEEFIQ